jgi:hypothetical protein
MRRLQETSIRVAGLAVLSGAVLFGAFIFAPDSPMPFLKGAALAAVVGAAALLAGVVFSGSAGVDPPASKDREQGRAAAWALAQDDAELAALQRRRSILEDRLHIDESRVCARYNVACTCWSFCGREPEPNLLCYDLSSAVPEAAAASPSARAGCGPKQDS